MEKVNQSQSSQPIHFIFRNYDNSPLTEVWVSADKSEVRFKNYTDDLLLRCFGNRENVTYKDVDHFFRRRSFPENRSDIKQILESLHMDHYDAHLLAKHYAGRNTQDDQWIEFL